MGGVRRGRTFGSGAALLALALQLVLAFGHVHVEDFAGIGVRAGSAEVTAGPGADGDGDRHGAGHDACAICATIHLARTLLAPTPPAIALPASRAFTPVDISERHHARRAPAHPFQARGPPQA